MPSGLEWLFKAQFLMAFQEDWLFKVLRANIREVIISRSQDLV
jgi:hypothetical protein